MKEFTKWKLVAVFAIAMAWVESAVVYYLRTMIDRIEPYQSYPLPVFGGLGQAELVREAATLVMLFIVGWLAGRNWRARWGYFVTAFGIWDIFYYVFLKVLTPWPHSLADWDILFLLPLPWWGPVWAPVSIAMLMIIWGTLASQCDAPNRSGHRRWTVWGANGVGIVLALYVFMADAIRVAHEGAESLRHLLPLSFNWPLFCVALGLMAAPVTDLSCRLWSDKSRKLIPLETVKIQ